MLNILSKLFSTKKEIKTDYDWVNEYIDEINKGGKVYRKVGEERICVYRTFGGYWHLQLTKSKHFDYRTEDELFDKILSVYRYNR